MSTTQTAVVTAASRGIGAGLVTRFSEKGYNVVGNSRAISDSTNLTPSPQLVLVDGDIGDSATAQNITDTAIARFGRIDVLVNNGVLSAVWSVGMVESMLSASAWISEKGSHVQCGPTLRYILLEGCLIF